MLDRLRRDDQGGFALWILIMMPVLFAMVGFTLDVGLMIGAHRQANNVAASSARAGAQVVSQQAIYVQGVALLESGSDDYSGATAESRAVQLAEAQGGEDVTVEFPRGDLIKVELTYKSRTRFLSFLGIPELEVTGRSTARIRSAVFADDFDTSTTRDEAGAD